MHCESHIAVGSEQDLGQRGRQTVPAQILATGDYLRAQPARRGLFTTGQACRGISCAEQTGSAYEEIEETQNA